MFVAAHGDLNSCDWGRRLRLRFMHNVGLGLGMHNIDLGLDIL